MAGEERIRWMNKGKRQMQNKGRGETREEKEIKKGEERKKIK